MNVLVVDTSSWISYFAGKAAKEIDLALEEGRVYLSPVVCAEILSGKLRPKQESALVDFLNALPLTDSSREHWFRVGQTRRFLRSRSLSVSTPDAHIAQCCLDLEGYLVTEDQIFSRIAKHVGIRLLNAA